MKFTSTMPTNYLQTEALRSFVPNLCLASAMLFTFQAALALIDHMRSRGGQFLLCRLVQKMK